LAYFAAFHTAEASIIQRTGKVANTHSGVLAEFARPLENEPDATREQLGYLARAYTFKQMGDYSAGEDATTRPKWANLAVIAGPLR
jgi:uncharacterized protein (UPF0332 family)